jgi:K+-sensing histidine kinase KdpD
MDAMTENSIRQEQVESFGRLIAGFSHDMKNHLGIIRESNGLMGDILEMGALSEDVKMVEQLEKSIASIERRVVVLADMLHHLSRLAHRPDYAYASFVINDLIREQYTFLERFSRLKQIDVVLELQEMLPALYNDPALLQHIFYRVYSQCLELLESGQSIAIVTEQEEQNIVIAFRFSPGMSPMDCEKKLNETLLAAIEKVNGKVTIGDHEKDSVEIRLTVSSLSIEGAS